MTALSLIGFITASCAVGVTGHGYLLTPRSKQAYSTEMGRGPWEGDKELWVRRRTSNTPFQTSSLYRCIVSFDLTSLPTTISISYPSLQQTTKQRAVSWGDKRMAFAVGRKEMTTLTTRTIG